MLSDVHWVKMWWISSGGSGEVLLLKRAFVDTDWVMKR